MKERTYITTVIRQAVRVFVTASLLAIGGPAFSKDIVIGMGNFGPYYIAESESGIFTDIVSAIFTAIPDHNPVFLFDRPNKRLWNDFRSGRVDAVTNLFDSVDLPGCRTDPVFRFRDVAVSRADAAQNISSIADLKDKHIVSFQGARAFFGNPFAKDIAFGSYREVADTATQVKVLMAGRVDVSVGDMFIFLYNLSKLPNANTDPSQFVFHDIFPAVESRMGFRDETLCRRFNEELRKFKADGRYEAIYKTYLQILGIS